jgi:hypothetical protein
MSWSCQPWAIGFSPQRDPEGAIAVGLVATVGPARRGLCIQPIEALRES